MQKSKGAVELTLFNAGTYVLSASEINEYVKDNKFVLTFEKDANADVKSVLYNSVRSERCC